MKKYIVSSVLLLTLILPVFAFADTLASNVKEFSYGQDFTLGQNEIGLLSSVSRDPQTLVRDPLGLKVEFVALSVSDNFSAGISTQTITLKVSEAGQTKFVEFKTPQTKEVGMNQIRFVGFVGSTGTFNITPLTIDESGTPVSNCVALHNTLRYRSKDANTNGEVSDLQDFLQSKNYLSSEPTGYFGLLTVSAVKSFQSANGISPTGYVGFLTRSKVAAISCGYVETTKKAPTPSTDRACASEYVSLRLKEKYTIGSKLVEVTQGGEVGNTSLGGSITIAPNSLTEPTIYTISIDPSSATENTIGPAVQIDPVKLSKACTELAKMRNTNKSINFLTSLMSPFYNVGDSIQLIWNQSYNTAGSVTGYIQNSQTGVQYFSGPVGSNLIAGYNHFTLPSEASNIPAGKYSLSICDNNTPNPVVASKPLCTSTTITINSSTTGLPVGCSSVYGYSTVTGLSCGTTNSPAAVDAQIKTFMANSRAQAELYYDSHGNYSGVCMNSINGIYSLMTKAAQQLSPSNTVGGINTSFVYGANGGTGSVVCHDSLNSWGATASLKQPTTSNAGWCVDSMGHSKAVTSFTENTLSCPDSTQTSTLNITTNFSLPNAKVGQPYSVALNVSGGSGSYSWSVNNGSASFPVTGLGFNQSYGNQIYITGTPAKIYVAGVEQTINYAFNFNVTVTSGSQTITKQFSITVEPANTTSNFPISPLTPEAGAVYRQGETFNIRWSGGDYGWPNHDLWLRDGGVGKNGAITFIGNATVQTDKDVQAFSWTIPYTVSPDSAYQILFGQIVAAGNVFTIASSSSSGLPAGCSSFSGYSTTTGQSCGNNPVTTSSVPVVTSLSTNVAGANDVITVYGNNFTSDSTINLHYNGELSGTLSGASIVSVTPTMLKFRLDSIFVANSVSGSYQISVVNWNGESASLPLSIRSSQVGYPLGCSSYSGFSTITGQACSSW